MIRRMASSFALAAAAGCVPSPSGPSIAQAPESAAAPPSSASESSACYAATLLVAKDVATAAAVDPVETQMGLLQTRAFFRGAPATLAARSQLETERLGGSAIFTLRVRAEPTRARATCEWVVAHALDQPPADEVSTWLGEQRTKLQLELKASEDALAQYDERHELRWLSAEDQAQAMRTELVELSSPHWRGKPGVDARRKALKDKMLELALVAQERVRLVRTSEGSAKLLAAIEEQESKQLVARMLERPLRLLDSCAVCESR